MRSPKNQLQRRLGDQHRQALAPDPNAFVESTCKILRVYDPESEQFETFPKVVSDLIASKPGMLFCLVELPVGRRMILPMEESLDQIYSTYGNSAVLEDAPGKIKYRNYNVRNGTVSVARYRQAKLVDVNKTSYVADIGAIIGI